MWIGPAKLGIPRNTISVAMTKGKERGALFGTKPVKVRNMGFAKRVKLEKRKDRLKKFARTKARAAFAVPGKTLKGCECDLWSSHNGYTTSFGAACGSTYWKWKMVCIAFYLVRRRDIIHFELSVICTTNIYIYIYESS